MSKEKVGFIGLGVIGKPMAQNLLKGGIDILVYDIIPERVRELERLGAKGAKSAKEIGAASDIVIIMVRDTSQAEEVILGKEGVLEAAREGSVIVIMSTIDPLFCQRAEKVAAKKGVGMIDAPVTGGPGGAETRNLGIMVGGTEYLLERCRYLLEAMGNRIVHVGGIGMGEVVKLANNSITTVIAGATAGAIALATKAGVDSEKFLKIVQSGTANSWIAQNWDFYRKKAKVGPTELAITYKDLRLALDLAKAYGVPLPLSEVIAQLDMTELIASLENQAFKLA